MACLDVIDCKGARRDPDDLGLRELDAIVEADDMMQFGEDALDADLDALQLDECAGEEDDLAAACLGECRAQNADACFELGMMYATGRSVPTDLVTAHKWFNIAALRGNAEAARLRREIAAEMSESEIAAAQRAARDWLAREDSAAA